MSKRLPGKAARAVNLLTNICINDRIYEVRLPDELCLRTFFLKDSLARELDSVRYQRAPAILHELYNKPRDRVEELFIKQALVKRTRGFSLEDLQEQVDAHLQSRIKKFVYELILVDAAKEATRPLAPLELKRGLFFWLW